MFYAGSNFMRCRRGVRAVALCAAVMICGCKTTAGPSPAGTSIDEADLGPQLRVAWQKGILTIRGADIPGRAVEVWYLEAFCRAGSTDRDWNDTVIKHETVEVDADDERGRWVMLRSTLADGVVVDHVITAERGEVDFRVTARNPTDKVSQADWAQPCIRVGDFTGTGESQTDDKYAYVPHCFIWQQGQMRYMPTPDWATEARYTPGQVWAAPGVDRNDVNPRPLNPHVPDCGLIGCVSADKHWLLATAWEPYQELFVGVIRCLHSDFRIGGLAPGQTKVIRGKIYLMPNSPVAPATLIQRYRHDFPEHLRQQ